MNKLQPFLTWIAAIVTGFLIANIFCFAYERPVGWIDTPNGASKAVRKPGSLLVHGNEGYALTKIDKYGYTNESKPLQDSYVLVMGTSHTQGKEVSTSQRYTTIVNNILSQDPNKIYIFNIASDGHFLPSQIKYFNSAITAYPNSKAVILEINNTDFNSDEIIKACDQQKYDPSNSAEAFNNYNAKDNLKLAVKESLPLLSQIKSQIETAEKTKEIKQKDFSGYPESINKDLSLIRSEYSGPIAFMYHPETEISENGTLNLKYSETWEIFKNACEANDIDIIDLGPAIEDEYKSSRMLPYGFMNTSPGTGHFNKTGHRIAAEALIKYLESL